MSTPPSHPNRPPPVIPAARPHSRRQMDRIRRQRAAFVVLVWAVIAAGATGATGATACVYLIATQGLELQFSLQIKP